MEWLESGTTQPIVLRILIGCGVLQWSYKTSVAYVIQVQLGVLYMSLNNWNPCLRFSYLIIVIEILTNVDGLLFWATNSQKSHGDLLVMMKTQPKVYF